MRIQFVCGAGTIFGKEIITLSLMEGLAARGHEVACLTSTWGDRSFTRRLEASGIAYARLPVGFISKSLSWSAVRMTLHQLAKLPGLWRGYRRQLREFKPDVVVHTNFHHVFLLYPLLDARRDFFHVHDPFQPTSFYRRLFRRLNRRLAAFIGVSEFIRSLIIGLGVPRENVFAVLNGIEVRKGVEAEAPAPESEFPRTNGGSTSNGVIRIGIVGQVGEWKGHDDFVEAARSLKACNLPFACSIFGRGEEDYVESLKAKISRYDLQQQITWAGFVHDPGEIFRRTDICVVPSRSNDPCPTVAIEAAHFGVPVVASRRGGLPELVRDGKTGYLVDAERPEQLTEKLKLLIEDEKLRRRMATAARLHGLQHLTRERMVREMEAILDGRAKRGHISA